MFKVNSGEPFTEESVFLVMFKFDNPSKFLMPPSVGLKLFRVVIDMLGFPWENVFLFTDTLLPLSVLPYKRLS